MVALPACAYSGESEHRFRRIHGYRHMAGLILALDNWSESFHQPHKAAWNPLHRSPPTPSSTANGTSSWIVDSSQATHPLEHALRDRTQDEHDRTPDAAHVDHIAGPVNRRDDRGGDLFGGRGQPRRHRPSGFPPGHRTARRRTPPCRAGGRACRATRRHRLPRARRTGARLRRPLCAPGGPASSPAAPKSRAASCNAQPSSSSVCAMARPMSEVAPSTSAVSTPAVHGTAFPSSAGSARSKLPFQILPSPVNWPVRIAAMA